jgi:hypothetical protein
MVPLNIHSHGLEQLNKAWGACEVYTYLRFTQLEMQTGNCEDMGPTHIVSNISLNQLIQRMNFHFLR